MTITETTPAPLTEKQRKILEWIALFCKTHGYSPTIREIAAAFGIRSPNGVTCHLKPLARKGRIAWQPRHSRTVRPIGGVS